MHPAAPSIDPQVISLAPGFRALSLSVNAASIPDPDVASTALDRACQSVLAGGPDWSEAHLLAWAETFRRFGAKPQRTPCSAEALRKWVLRDGKLPSVNPVVDLYNAISLQYAVPVGGENYTAYIGAPRLVIAEGSELFDTLKGGEPVQESPERGEVVWRDDVGVTCRRWNWRQGIRTRINAETKQMWFILESLPAMPLGALHEAGNQLAEGLKLMMPDAAIESALIGIEP